MNLRKDLKDATKRAGREGGGVVADRALSGLGSLLRSWFRGERPLRTWLRQRRADRQQDVREEVDTIEEKWREKQGREKQ